MPPKAPPGEVLQLFGNQTQLDTEEVADRIGLGREAARRRIKDLVGDGKLVITDYQPGNDVKYGRPNASTMDPLKSGDIEDAIHKYKEHQRQQGKWDSKKMEYKGASKVGRTKRKRGRGTKNIHG